MENILSGINDRLDITDEKTEFLDTAIETIKNKTKQKTNQ